MTDVLVPDVNNSHRVIDWTKVRALSPVLIAKMTQGATYVAPTFDDHRDGARAHGFAAFGGYHFWEPDVDPVKQAKNAVAALGSLRDDPPEFLALDIESGSDWPAYEAFVRHTDTALGTKTWLYAGQQAAHAPAHLRDRPLWVARYYDRTTNPKGQPGIGEALWQFTDRYPCAGVNGGTVDCSVHRGDLPSLLDLIRGDDDEMTPAEMSALVEAVANRVVEKLGIDTTHSYTVAATRAGLTAKIDGAVKTLTGKIDGLTAGGGAVDVGVLASEVAPLVAKELALLAARGVSS